VPDLDLVLVLLGHAGWIWAMRACLLLASPHSLGHGCVVTMGISHLVYVPTDPFHGGGR
jgi:hypothetical protein